MNNKQKKQNEIIQDFENQVQFADEIIELGANIGLVTKQLLKHNKVIHAFEPEPEAFKELAKIEAKNLIKINKAAWIKKEKIKLHRHKDWLISKSTTSSSLNRSKSNVDDKNSVFCDTLDIADYINKLDKKVIIKMDVEGIEYELLHHLLNKKAFKNIVAVFCEFHPKKIKYGYLKHFILNVRLLFTNHYFQVKNWF